MNITNNVYKHIYNASVDTDLDVASSYESLKEESYSERYRRIVNLRRMRLSDTTIEDRIITVRLIDSQTYRIFEFKSRAKYFDKKYIKYGHVERLIAPNSIGFQYFALCIWFYLVEDIPNSTLLNTYNTYCKNISLTTLMDLVFFMYSTIEDDTRRRIIMTDIARRCGPRFLNLATSSPEEYDASIEDFNLFSDDIDDLIKARLQYTSVGPATKILSHKIKDLFDEYFDGHQLLFE